MRYAKKVYDSLHGFIHLTEAETKLIYTLPFQRLHYIHQLGVAYLVYPGAVHKRFEHSLGVMHVASKIYDHLIDLCCDEFPDIIPERGSYEEVYARKVLRLASLCHDLGHLPFSHTAEEALTGIKGHERWTEKLIDSHYLAPVWELVDPDVEKVKEDVKSIAVGDVGQDPWKHILCKIITADFFGADRIDYLLRDAKYTGVSYGMFDYAQLIEMLRILPDKHEIVTIGIEENGIESCEALLLARHFMHRRVYQYASVKAYSYHLQNFMALNYADAIDDLETYVALTDNEVTTRLHKAAADPSMKGHADAACIVDGEKRFHAFAISSPHVLEKITLPESSYSTELGKLKQGGGLDFPVLMNDGSILRGSDVSDIYVPQTNKNWVYVEPESADAMKTVLREKR